MPDSSLTGYAAVSWAGQANYQVDALLGDTQKASADTERTGMANVPERAPLPLPSGQVDRRRMPSRVASDLG